MNNTSSFKQLLFSQTLDTWLVSGCSEVGALVHEVYLEFMGHELGNNSSKAKVTLIHLF